MQKGVNILVIFTFILLGGLFSFEDDEGKLLFTSVVEEISEVVDSPGIVITEEAVIELPVLEEVPQVQTTVSDDANVEENTTTTVNDDSNISQTTSIINDGMVDLTNAVSSDSVVEPAPVSVSDFDNEPVYVEPIIQRVERVVKTQIPETSKNRIFSAEEIYEESRIKDLYEKRVEAIKLFLFDYYLSGNYLEFEKLSGKVYLFNSQMLDQEFSDKFFGLYNKILSFDDSERNFNGVLQNNVLGVNVSEGKSFLQKSPILIRISDLGEFYKRRMAFYYSSKEISGQVYGFRGFANVLEAEPIVEVEEPVPVQEPLVEEEDILSEEVSISPTTGLIDDAVVEHNAVIENIDPAPQPEVVSEPEVIVEEVIVEEIEYIDSFDFLEPEILPSEINNGFYLINESFKIHEFNDLYFVDLFFSKKFNDESINDFTFQLGSDNGSLFRPQNVFVTNKEVIIVFSNPEVVSASSLYVKDLKSNEEDIIDGYFSLRLRGDRYIEKVKKAKESYEAYIHNDISFSSPSLSFGGIHGLVASESTLAIEMASGGASNQCAVLVFGNDLRQDDGDGIIPANGISLLSKSKGSLPVNKDVVTNFVNSKQKEFLGFVYLYELESHNNKKILYLNLKSPAGIPKGRYATQMSFEVYCP